MAKKQIDNHNSHINTNIHIYYMHIIEIRAFVGCVDTDQGQSAAITVIKRLDLDRDGSDESW